MGWGGFASLDLLARGVGTKFSMQIYYSCITYLHTKYSTMQWIYMYGTYVVQSSREWPVQSCNEYIAWDTKFNMCM